MFKKEVILLENSIARTTIREKLILAGIDEIGDYGISGFSLRHVAMMCSVSCATPYNYFKNKDGFIKEIKKYIREQWMLFKSEITAIYRDDEKKMLAEIGVFFIKFLIANPNYRAIIMADLPDSLPGEDDYTRDFMDIEMDHYMKINSFSEREVKRKNFVIRAIVYEAAVLFEKNEIENCEKNFDFVRYCITKELMMA